MVSNFPLLCSSTGWAGPVPSSSLKFSLRETEELWHKSLDEGEMAAPLLVLWLVMGTSPLTEEAFWYGWQFCDSLLFTSIFSISWGKIYNHEVRTDLTWNRVSHGDLLLWKWTLRAQRFKQKKSQGDNWTETKSYRFWRVSPLTFEDKCLNGFRIADKICWIVSTVFVRKF